MGNSLAGVPQFDPALGTLTAIQLTVNASLSFSITGEHANPNANIDYNVDFVVSPADSSVGIATLDMNSNDLVTFGDLEWDVYLPASATGTSIGLGDYGTSEIAFNVGVQVDIASEDDDTPYVPDDYIRIEGWGEANITVTYTYTPAVTNNVATISAVAVPEPASLGITSLCSMLLLRRRR